MEELSRHKLHGLHPLKADHVNGRSQIEVDYFGLRCSATQLCIRDPGVEDGAELVRHAADVCRTVASLHHPHIVQFLGVSYDDASSPRVLYFVTEGLPLTLASCINHFGVLPDEVAYSILGDVALALRYLHEQSPPVVHGDLSAKAILLARDFTAKVSGVGVSRLVNYGRTKYEKPHRPQAVPWYLPPEVTGGSKEVKLHRKVDVFSLGIVMLHTFCGRPPIPTIPTESDSEDDAAEFCAATHPSQADMRVEYFNELRFDHPVMETILNCLRNMPSLRPEVREVSLSLCKSAPPQPALFSTHYSILQRIQKQKEVQKESVQNIALQVVPEENLQPTKEVEGMRAMVSRVKAQNVFLRRSLRRKGKRVVRNCNQNNCKPAERHLEPEQVRIDWERCAELPVGMFLAQATVIGSMCYVGGGLTENGKSDFCVFEYSIEEDNWCTLVSLPVKLFGLGRLKDELVVIGGRRDEQSSISDEMFVFDTHAHFWRRSESYLNEARFSPAVLHCKSALIVAGGMGKKGAKNIGVLSSIEVLSEDAMEWTLCGDLPTSASVSFPSSTLVGSDIFLLGGYHAQTAVSASHHCHASSSSAFVSGLGLQLDLWKSLPDLPHLQSTGLSIGGCLLALGGTDCPYSDPVRREIYALDVGTRRWVQVGELPYASCHSAAVELQGGGGGGGGVLLIGGWVRPGEERASRAVYRGTLCVTTDT